MVDTLLCRSGSEKLYELFVEVEPKLLWAELDKKSVYGKGTFFLLVTADEWNYDDDRWLGIYVSKNEAREAYDRATAWWNEEQKQVSVSTSQRVDMFEYSALDDRFREVDRKRVGLKELGDSTQR